MNKSTIPILTQEVIEAVRSGNLPDGTGLPIKKYLRTDSDRQFLSCVVYIEEWDRDETACCLRGAYYGYTGGGEYDGGFFFIDIENDVNNTLDFSDAEQEEHADLYNALMFECGRFYEENDGAFNLTKYSEDLIVSGEEGEDGSIYMDEDFSTDTLEVVSSQWCISLRFEE